MNEFQQVEILKSPPKQLLSQLGHWKYSIYFNKKEPRLKRPLDFCLSLAMLMVSMPLWLFIALAIKIDDRGPIFYRQKRWGRNGETFYVIKFRSMKVYEKSRIIPAKANDNRITRVGRFLRATGLDELPQLINILKGEMSFVGPRSLAVGELIYNGNGYVFYEDIPGFWERLCVRPGLTSIATIFRPKDIPPHKKFRYDLLYIRKMSFLFDLKLIFLSFIISFLGRWERRGRKI